MRASMTQPRADAAFRAGLPLATPAGEKLLAGWLAHLGAADRQSVEAALEASENSNVVLAGIASHSPFLWKLIKADPARAAVALAAPRGKEAARLCTAMQHFPADPDIEVEMTGLRRLRAGFALVSALDDLFGLPVAECMEHLTRFADAAVATATRLALEDAVRTVRLAPQSEDWIASSGYIVIALGKHGAGELNYSSDIDLAIFYDDEKVPLAEGREVQRVMVSVTQRLVKLLNEVTPQGFVFRTDLRLRPDPGSNAIAMPVNAALAYYEALGQNWERAAMIKARPVAGDHAAGRAFLAELVPFIWRKYFDYAAIADIHAMKRQIHAHKGFAAIAVEGHDLKLGRGGIREIEFFVQTQQLVFGGRRPVLRGSRTLDMLAALHAENWVTAKATRELSECYLALRAIEHRLQMMHDEQTQRLPADAAAFKALAGFCRQSVPAFRTRLHRLFETVARHYARLFEEGGDLASEAGDLVFTGTDHDPETLQTLSRMGFADAKAASETVRGWHFGRRPAIASPRAREVLTEMTPALLTALSRSGDADAGIRALDALFGRMMAVVQLLSLLKSNPALLSLFAEMLGSAPRLAEIVARTPHALDHLIDPDFARPLPEAERRARILGPLEHTQSFDGFLDTLRDVASAEKLAIGARMISGVIDPLEAGPAYTLIAECAIEASLAAVERELSGRHGHIQGMRLAILGFGKLGGREMTAASDLDLVILYDAPPDSLSDGERPLVPSEYCARLTQRLIAALSAPTPRGVAFEIDLRLRPSGNKGPVALALSGFLDYQQTEAEIWEQMALTRARLVGGNRVFQREIASELLRLKRRPRDPALVRREIAAMRALIAQEKGEDDPLDIKTGRGGLVDLEFIAQSLVLTHAKDHEALCVTTDTRGMLVAARNAGLLTASDASVLIGGLDDWSRLSQASRSWFGALPDPLEGSAARRMASVLGLPDGRRLLGRLAELRNSIRECFLRLVG
jgi:[glutamine synthetase] adenylyltransferase / [glutamine synthetase]-adenylyl-L-tyrosine phosphorylase